MLNVDIASERSLAPTPEGIPLKDRMVVIEDKVLKIPSQIREEMRVMDRWVEAGAFAAEAIGFGLTSTKGDISTVEEFIAPRVGNIFSINGYFLSEEQNVLCQMLAKASIIRLEAFGRGVYLEAEGGEGKKYGLFFDPVAGDSMKWAWMKGNLEQLFGDIPDKLEDFSGTKEIAVDLDEVVTSGNVLPTERFEARIKNTALETGLQLGYTMHYHPSFPIFADIHGERSRSEKEDFYMKLLELSVGDLTAMRELGVDFFEIRALGNPDHIVDSNFGVTSRFYRASLL